jgi:hypothetical protein
MKQHYANTVGHGLTYVIMTIMSLLLVGGAAAATLGESAPIRLNASVTVTEEVVRLSDVFSGDLTHADKVVTQAPSPGQRMVLAADWLATLAQNNGIDWRPSGPYDRALIFRPGQTIQSAEVIAAVRVELIANGMPKNFGLKPFTTLGAITIGLHANKSILVREATLQPTASQPSQRSRRVIRLPHLFQSAVS